MTGTAVVNADVAIVGASHAGLAMALALARTFGPDFAITLIERRGAAEMENGDKDPRAFALSAGSRRLLTALGVWPALAPHAEPVRAIDITDSSLEHAIRPVLLSYENVVGDGEAATHIVEADRLKRALVDCVVRCPGIRWLAPGSVAGLDAGAADIRLALAGGDGMSARLLIAADGAQSSVRELAGIKTVVWNYRQTGIVTIVAHERPHGGRAVQHFLPAGPFAILPLPGDRSCITWSESTENAQRILALDDAAFLAEVDQRFGGRLGRIELAGGRAGWPLAMQLSRTLVAPRLALIGDAARSVHPIAGQGLNLGFRDVAALADVVAANVRLGLDPSDTAGLERYERWRRFDGQASAAAYDALNRLFSNDSLLLRTARDIGLGLVDRLPGLKQLLVAEAAGLTGDVPQLLRGTLP